MNIDTSKFFSLHTILSQQLLSKNSIHILHTEYFVSHSYLLPNTLWDIVSNSLFFTESTILFLPIKLLFTFTFSHSDFWRELGVERKEERKIIFPDYFFFNLDGSLDHYASGLSLWISGFSIILLGNTFIWVPIFSGFHSNWCLVQIPWLNEASVALKNYRYGLFYY